MSTTLEFKSFKDFKDYWSTCDKSLFKTNCTFKIYIIKSDQVHKFTTSKQFPLKVLNVMESTVNPESKVIFEYDNTE